MSGAQLLRILTYIWILFGVYWTGFNLLRAPSANSQHRPTPRLRIAILGVSFVVIFPMRQTIPPALLILLALAWAGLALYWSTPGKSARSAEFKLYRLLRLIILAATFTLLFWPTAGIGFLGHRFIRASSAVALAGFVVALSGMALSVWARIHLGHYWSDKVVLQFNHRLIRSGPYTWMRHPIYSGVLLAVAGTALVVGEWRGVLAFTILLANYAVKAKREDQILACEFGDAFAEHMRSAGFLLPRMGYRK
jgi:protein-S-isoprenylcysteine O-methyltransferase Ste14